MAKKFKKLKVALGSEDMIQADIAEILKRSATYVGDRMQGKRQFTISDVYAICGKLDIPFEKIPEYWPPDEVLKYAAAERSCK